MADKPLRYPKIQFIRLKTQLAAIAGKLKDFETLAKLQALVDELRLVKQSYDLKLEQIIDSLEETAENYQTTIDTLSKDASGVSDTLATYEAKIRNFHRNLEIQVNRDSIVPSELNQTFRVPSSSQPKVESIKIPTFNGNKLEFRNWKGLFENLVHNQVELSNVQKLYYLKQSLVENAAELIRDFELTDSAYAQAWLCVIARYENKRLVVKTLFRKLMSIEPIKNDSQIRNLLDQFDVIIRSLQANGEEVGDTFSKFVAFHLASLLDLRTAKDFENSLDSSASVPNYECLRKFLSIRASTAEEYASKIVKPSVSENKPISISSNSSACKPKEKRVLTLTTSKTLKCVVCSRAHFLNQCDKFLKQSAIERFSVIKQNKLCVKCFNPFHRVAECSRANCGVCGGNHHGLLHREESPRTNDNLSMSSPESSSLKSTMSATISKQVDKVVILPTAVVYCSQRTKTGFEKIVHARALLDQGSQSNLISEAFVRKHRFSTYEMQPIAISGITGDTATSSSSTTLVVKSRYEPFQIVVNAEVVSKIPFTINRQAIVSTIQNNLKLECFAEKSIGHENVDMLIGAEFYEMLITNERKQVDGIFLRNSRLGWLISGPFVFQKPEIDSFCGLAAVNIQNQLQQFWQIEEVDVQVRKSEKTEHQQCAEFVEQTLTRNGEGQFVAKLPFKRPWSELGESYFRAKKQLLNFYRRYDAQTQELYRTFIQEYLDLNHMSRIDKNSNSVARYYIPHRAVMRPDSSTTKLRVVFNASAPTTSGLSLNDILMVGPTIQPDLLEILLRFRTHIIAFAADIAKMYRNILVDENERHLQSILWRWDEADQIEQFQLNTLTYGTAPASFIATRCLALLGNELLSRSPTGARAINSDFYMDDLMTGGKTTQEALRLQQIIHQTLQEAHFSLRKYVSNSAEFLVNIDPKLTEKSEDRTFGPKETVSLLGIQWNPTTDEFKIKLQLRRDKSFMQNLTKRVLLSEISRTFDPLGILSPVSVRAKLLLQEVWLEKKGWDELTSETIRRSFATYYNDLENLANLSFRRRYTRFDEPASSQLVGFSDASERAYAAVVYLRTTNEIGDVDSYIVAAKTKIAPKGGFKLTVPKLELQAAELLSRLIEKISNTLGISSVLAYSDSEVTIAWLQGDVNNWTVFVQNRVRKIVRIIPAQFWKYCNTKQNPADLATRGISVKKLINNKLWFHGPEFMHATNEIEKMSPSILVNIPLADLPEKRKAVLSIEKVKFCRHSLISKFSNFNQLVRVFAYVMRFVEIVRLRKLKVIRFAMSKSVTRSKRLVTFSSDNVYINSAEYKIALVAIIRYVQCSHYPKEIALVSNNKPLTKNNLLFNVNPFVDSDGIVRSRSRLQNSELSFEARNLIILPAKCTFVLTFVRYLHVRYFHSTVAFMINFIRSSYHIIGGLKNIVKRVVRECVICKRYSVQAVQQKIGQLPPCRVNVERPFSNVGVDLAGPFQIKCVGHRTTKIGKAYAAVFVCTVTRAVHIETLSSLSTESFISTLNRFTSRRGVPRKILSDNATNFVGSKNLLEASRSKQIDWEFIPPRAPHKGGLWEAAVKAAKRHLFRTVKNQILNYEELETILVQIEAILNSRPLCKEGESVLTPGHFLVGSNLLLPSMEIADRTICIGRRYILQQSIVQSFWRVWRKDYLNQLRHLAKWRNSQPNLNVGDVVVLVDDLVPPATWKLGKVEAVYPGKDNLVRVVSVMSGNSIFKRDVRELILLVENASSTGGVC